MLRYYVMMVDVEKEECDGGIFCEGDVVHESRKIES